MRLLPDARDGYIWKVLPEKQYLFAKQLSKLSVGAYMELCREIGKSFEAIVSPTYNPRDQPMVEVRKRFYI